MRSLVLCGLVLLAGLSAGCEGNDFRIDPLLSTDTLVLAAPTSATDLPSALDLTPEGAMVDRVRFPERLQDAELWDLALRVVDGRLSFVPAGQVGLSDGGGRSRAAITEALDGRTFDSVREAPNRKDFVTDRAVPLAVGAVYVARSRLASCGFTASEYYAKLQPLEIDPARQTVRFQIVNNSRCGDPRLVEVD